MGLSQYGNQDIRSEKVYFAGTTVLADSQPLCYDIPGSVAPSGTVDKRTFFGVSVKIPVTANLAYYAGNLAAGEAGKTGPCFTEIDKPALGDVLQGRVDGTTDIAVGDAMSPNNATGVFVKSGGAAITDAVIMIALQAFTTDGQGVIWMYRSK